ncbi:MAG: GNAT family N-acetyltransferase, partial [Gammaproteobacteria bacterium]|nr:GNAT family N-acetyltransferase [Gammaproteobacteria bacterium]
SAAWASEVAVSFGRTPASCIIAIKGGRPIGFACYDAIKLNFFGPTGVLPEYRKLGIGKALLVYTLTIQKLAGYAYAIIGAAGPVEFYAKAVNAIPIADSEPGIYGDMLR